VREYYSHFALYHPAHFVLSYWWYPFMLSVICIDVFVGKQHAFCGVGTRSHSTT
jgi:hypothetical protein